MQIRKIKQREIKQVTALWYTISQNAHFFISSEYWKKNKKTMEKKYLPTSETYVAIEDDNIIGFISMKRNNLAALFVKISSQGKGIGTKLLDYIKQKRKTIQLTVYKKNDKSLHFYQNRGFIILKERKDNNTNEIEYVMKWNK